MSDKPLKATPHEALIGSILDPCIPKNEREWAAAREIESLKAELKKARLELWEHYAYQYKGLVECDENQLSPDALEVRWVLLKDRTELEKAKNKLKAIDEVIDPIWDETITGKQALFALNKIGEIRDGE